MPEAVLPDLADGTAAPELLRAELAFVTGDPGFNRSPSLVRLINYLVEATIAGQADRLKSYTVAVEGLGRAPDYDAQINTYARVLVARLRRRLESLYREEGADRPWRMEIPQGTYQVRLVPNQQGRPTNGSVPSGRSSVASWPARWPRRGLLAAVLLACGVLFGWLFFRDDPAAKLWRVDNFPVVLIETRSTDAAAEVERLRDFQDAMSGALAQYETLYLASRAGRQVTHKLRLESTQAPGGPALRAVLVDMDGNREVIVGQIALAGLPAGSTAEAAAASELAFKTFGFSGVLTTAERAASSGPQSPYGCWLRFSAAVLVDGGLQDAQLKECATRWHGEAPQHPLAASLYGWVLANDAISTPFDLRRQWKFQEAIRVLEEARVTNPRSRHVLLALARVEAQAGNVAAVREHVAQLASRKLMNPDFKNVAGTLLILANDPAGERLVDEAIATHPLTPPPRYYLGKFVAAVMRDDLVGAQAAAARITAGDTTSSWSHLVRAATYARAGQLDQARRSWAQLQASQPLLALEDDLIIDRLPAADPVKQRFRAWLDPILDE